MREQTKRRIFARCVAAALVLIPAFLVLADRPDAWGAEPPEEEVDCRVFETRETSITLGFKAGNFLFEVGPEVTFGLQQGIAWDKVVQGLIARFVEVCTRYNAGLVTAAEFEQRIREIEVLYVEAQKLERRLIAATHARARSAHDELEGMVGGRTRAAEAEPEQVALKDSLGILSRRIDQLEPVGRHLKPKVPCRTPDMLGMPGRSC